MTKPLLKVSGNCSWFGGPEDTGVDSDEGLAFFYDVSDKPSLFLPEQPEGTTGLARRLNPETFYVACRWDYDVTPKDMLAGSQLAMVYAPRTRRAFLAHPGDWGPHEDTNRVADLSPGLLEALEIGTDDEVEVVYPAGREDLLVEEEKPTMKVVISSGHAQDVGGASGYLDEVTEARKVVDAVADMLADRGVDVTVFHDNDSSNQSENLSAICDFHNSQTRDLDVSVHFNANVETSKPVGTECLWVSQEELAANMAGAIAKASGLIDRGAKYRDDLAFLNNTEEPAILIEVCFVDSTADADIYDQKFEAICRAIADCIVDYLRSENTA